MEGNGREPALLTTRQAGHLLGLSQKTVIRLCRSGDLRAVRLGGPRGRWRVVRASVLRVVEDEPVRTPFGVRTTTAREGEAT